MIVSKLSGGLGNQMFQYALGRNLSLKNNSRLVLDTSCLQIKEGVTGREFALGDFMINADVRNEAELEKQFLQKVKRTLNPFYRKQVVLEKQFNFDPEILATPSNSVLVGYWQSEKYFAENLAVIKKELEFKPHIKNQLNELGKKIIGSNSVSIHFRRGDYVSNSEINQIHGLCRLEYYHDALDLIFERHTDIRLFIFSDDLDWVKRNFKRDCEMNFVENSGSAISDMYLMSLCKHHIIANSSFSWWGAWLATFPQKIVIAPKNWFKVSSRNSSDILPPSWIRL